MFYKRIFRKPLKLIVLVLLVFGGIGMLGQIHQEIRTGKIDLKNISENTEIKCKLYSPIRMGYFSQIPAYIADRVGKLKEIENIYVESEVPVMVDKSNFIKAVITDGEGIVVTAISTGDIDEFAKRNGAIINMEEKYKESFKEEETICIVSEVTAKTFDLKVGDTFSCFLADGARLPFEEIPRVPLKVVGTFTVDPKNSSLEARELEKEDINYLILPQKLMFSREGIMHSVNVEEIWWNYRVYDFNIKKKYNMQFIEVEDKIEEIIDDYTALQSSSREFYKALKPLEKKIKLQENLYITIKFLLIALITVLAYFISRGEKDEILIRLIFGEKRRKILLSTWISIGSIFLIVIAGAYGLMTIFFTIDPYLIVQLIGIPIICSLIVVFMIIRQDLLKLYQSKEE
ncbi:MAG: hypothetical protein GX219_09890 [Tissierellia bacterium]|nr:hypothetical protein [Tissierellia bacterium]